MPLDGAWPPVLVRQALRNFTQCDPACCTEAEAALALTLFALWAAKTGRRLRPVPIAQLTPQELIDFWADDQFGEADSYRTDSPVPALTASVSSKELQTVNGVNFSREPSPIMHTTLVAVDIVGFCRRYRDADAQIHARDKMYEQLTEAFAMTGLPWHECHLEDRGDGALIVAPPDADADRFLNPLAHHLHAVLRRSNRLASDSTRLRLRVAVHHGRVLYDAYGVAGHAVNHLFRLLEAPAFKKQVESADADLTMVISDQLYQDAAEFGGLFNPAAYQKLRIASKETHASAWLWLPPDLQQAA
jgi:class 3 adenylate cyclase